MDPTLFDTLTRSLSDLSGRIPTRRGLLQTFGASLLSLGALEQAGEAKKGHKRRRRTKKRLCLFGQRRCRDKRCHGCCSDADCGGNACETGNCFDCPRNERLCRGGCIPENACCVDDECTGGRVCLDGACGCRASERECNGSCIPVDACCGTDCPPGSPTPTCTPANCRGCCDGTTCKDGDSPNFCGRNGEACTQCSATNACIAGDCGCPGGTVVCPNGSCRACEGSQICGTGNACVCLTECCSDRDCSVGVRCSQNGVCLNPPTCTAPGQVSVDGCRDDGTDPLCCSGVCDVGTLACTVGAPGTPCLDDSYCASANCNESSFRCV